MLGGDGGKCWNIWRRTRRYVASSAERYDDVRSGLTRSMLCWNTGWLAILLCGCHFISRQNIFTSRDSKIMLVTQQAQRSSCKGLWLRPLGLKLVWPLQPNSCVYLFRRVFTERGLCAIPLVVFEFAILSSAYSSANEARVGIRPHDAMQAIAIVVSTWRDVSVPVASVHTSRGPLCFFEALCANPQNLVHIGAHHRSTPRGLVRMRQASRHGKRHKGRNGCVRR